MARLPFSSSEYAAKFRELNPGLIWTPTNARASAKRRRSYYVQLIILAVRCRVGALAT